MSEDYIGRINNVLVYIDENLEAALSLESISKIAFYSPFHLHRLFKAITNETLNTYITRKRIEKAAMQLIGNKKLAISEIAAQNGFNSNSSFTRAFTRIYGQSPAGFRKMNAGNFSKIGKMNSRNGKESFITAEYFCHINEHKKWIEMSAKINITEMPGMQLAYITQIGVDGLENTFERIIRWARPKGLLSADGAIIVRVFHDSFKITDEDKVRMSIGLIVKGKINTEGEVAVMTIPGGKCMTGRFEIEVKDFERSWDGLFIHMNEKGYKKADRNPFEIYYNNPAEHPEKKCIVDLCIPVE